VVLAKTKQLLADVSSDTRRTLASVKQIERFQVGSCATEFWEPESVDLVVRLEHRTKAHILVAFLGYALWVTFKHLLQRRGTGL
jgi:hypothetical protein